MNPVFHRSAHAGRPMEQRILLCLVESGSSIGLRNNSTLDLKAMLPRCAGSRIRFRPPVRTDANEDGSARSLWLPTPFMNEALMRQTRHSGTICARLDQRTRSLFEHGFGTNLRGVR